MKLAFTMLFTILSLSYLAAQETGDRKLEDNLTFYADVMINASEASSRTFAAENFDELFDIYLQQKSFYRDSSEFFKYISILDTPDDKFKLVTWLIKGDNETYDFRGFVVRPDGTFIQLVKNDEVSQELEYSSSNHENWYGCLYYKMIPNKDTDGYVLFGYDPNGRFDNQKIVDHIYVKANAVDFGAEIFEDKDNRDTYKNRLVLKYSSDASVTVNYNVDMKMIVHDHLSEVMGFQAGQGPTAIPDGTYEGYYFKDGKWKYKEKLFNHVYDEAPRPQPVFKDTEDKSK